jgi:hypothetical protein
MTSEVRGTGEARWTGEVHWTGGVGQVNRTSRDELGPAIIPSC